MPTNDEVGAYLDDKRRKEEAEKRRLEAEKRDKERAEANKPRPSSGW